MPPLHQSVSFRRRMTNWLPSCDRSINKHTEDEGTMYTEKIKPVKAEPSISDSSTLSGSPSPERQTLQGPELEEARFLLRAAGYDQDASDFDSRKALNFAARHGMDNVVRLLLDAGADVSSRSRGYSALLIACKHSHEEVAKLLLERGARIDATSDYDESALHTAAKGGRTKVVELLLEKGANMKLKSKNGSTPLHAAAKYGKEAAVEVLLEKGADPLAKNDQGALPLHLAAKHKDQALNELLRRYMPQGADWMPKSKWAS